MLLNTWSHMQTERLKLRTAPLIAHFIILLPFCEIWLSVGFKGQFSQSWNVWHHLDTVMLFRIHVTTREISAYDSCATEHNSVPKRQRSILPLNTQQIFSTSRLTLVWWINTKTSQENKQAVISWKTEWTRTLSYKQIYVKPWYFS